MATHGNHIFSSSVLFHGTIARFYKILNFWMAITIYKQCLKWTVFRAYDNFHWFWLAITCNTFNRTIWHLVDTIVPYSITDDKNMMLLWATVLKWICDIFVIPHKLRPVNPQLFHGKIFWRTLQCFRKTSLNHSHCNQYKPYIKLFPMDQAIHLCSSHL